MENVFNLIKHIQTRTGEYIDLNRLTFNLGKLCIDNIPISKKSTHRINYTCPNCNYDNIIHLPLFIRKIQHAVLTCKHCKDYVDVENNCTEEFKFEYYKKYLTFDEFNRIKHLIVSFQNTKFNAISDFEYKPMIKVGNQHKYIPQMYDKTRCVYEDIKNVVFNCEKCNSDFLSQELELHKNKYKIWCTSCTRVKKNQHVHYTKNCENVEIRYRKTYELQFIMLCNKYNIPIYNDTSSAYLYNIPGYNRKIEIRHKKKWNEILNNDIYIVYKNTLELQFECLKSNLIV